MMEIAWGFALWGFFFLKIWTHFFLEVRVLTKESLDNILWDCSDAGNLSLTDHITQSIKYIIYVTWT